MDIVEFPGLWGLKVTVSRVAFQLFGISINWYGIIIAFSFLAAVLLAMRDSKKFELEPDNIIDLVLFSIPVAIISARLFYVLFTWENFKDNLIEIFNIRNGGLAIYGGVLGGILVLYFFAKRKKIGLWKLLDFCIVYVPLAQAIGRWGNFINQEAFGTNTSLPWGMTSQTIKRYLTNNIINLQSQGINVDPNLPVHPAFLYESLWNVGMFFLLLWYRKRKKLEGEVFFMYMILYGFARFWIEGIRTDSLMIGSLRISQVLAGVFVVAFATLLLLRRRKYFNQNIENSEVVESKYGKILESIREEENNHGVSNDDGIGQQRVNQQENTGNDEEDSF